jgi:predicted GIY-YIG superfamily endonuclease
MAELSTEDFIVPRESTGRVLRCCHLDDRGSVGYQHESIYRFFDASGRLLYVGITFNIVSRWAKHRRKQPWWSEVRRARVTCFQGDGIARQHELEAIVKENPVYNIARPKAVC